MEKIDPIKTDIRMTRLMRVCTRVRGMAKGWTWILGVELSCILQLLGDCQRITRWDVYTYVLMASADEIIERIPGTLRHPYRSTHVASN